MASLLMDRLITFLCSWKHLVPLTTEKPKLKFWPFSCASRVFLRVLGFSSYKINAYWTSVSKILSCVTPCPALLCPALPCPALPSPALPLVKTIFYLFVLLIRYFFNHSKIKLLYNLYICKAYHYYYWAFTYTLSICTHAQLLVSVCWQLGTSMR